MPGKRPRVGGAQSTADRGCRTIHRSGRPRNHMRHIPRLFSTPRMNPFEEAAVGRSAGQRELAETDDGSLAIEPAPLGAEHEPGLVASDAINVVLGRDETGFVLSAERRGLN